MIYCRWKKIYVLFSPFSMQFLQDPVNLSSLIKTLHEDACACCYDIPIPIVVLKIPIVDTMAIIANIVV